MSSDRIELKETITSAHNDLLVCPTCFNKWKLTKRKVDIELEITGNKPVQISPEIDYLAEYIINRSLSGDIFCPDCNGPGSELISLDSGIYDTIKLFNEKGYKTVFSCAGGENGSAYIALRLGKSQLNEFKKVVPVEALKEYSTIENHMLIQNYQVDENADIPDELEFIRELYLNYVPENVSRWNKIHAKNWNIAIRSTNKSSVIACELFYKLASILKDLSTKEDTK